LGQLTEAYANFGVIGILIIMALQGLIFGVLDGLFNGPESEGGRAIYLSIMVSLLNGIGASTPIIFGSLLQNSLGSALILRLFSSRWRAGRPEPSEPQLQRGHLPRTRKPLGPPDGKPPGKFVERPQ
jgi:hypothetical protein